MPLTVQFPTSLMIFQNYLIPSDNIKTKIFLERIFDDCSKCSLNFQVLYFLILHCCAWLQSEPGPGHYEHKRISKSASGNAPGFLSSAQRNDRISQKFFTRNSVSSAPKISLLSHTFYTPQFCSLGRDVGDQLERRAWVHTTRNGIHCPYLLTTCSKYSQVLIKLSVQVQIKL